MGGTNWYILQYLILYVCAPMLNQYVETTDKKTLRRFIIFMLLLNVYVGYVWHNGPFSHGYNFILMSTLYIMARYMRKYLKDRIERLSFSHYFLLYVLFTLIYAAFIMYWHIKGAHAWPFIYAYNNPLIIISSTCLFCAFLHVEFYSTVINKIAKTVLAVLLIHMHPILQQYFYSTVVDFGKESPLKFILYLSALVAVIFVVSFCLDQLRQFCFDKIARRWKWVNS